jgi:UDP-N-acetylglucosamine 2-epimerase (non-hydrolysing)/GDP/UDP-N,N'-diacetylbacillosamine 2-epimerase (hydrolysing)
LIEAPAAVTPTVNIGIRQKGRPQAASVVDCPEQRAAIEAAIRRALDPKMDAVIAADSPPYGKAGNAAQAIVARLRDADLTGILRKRFHDLPAAAGR